MKHKVLLTHFVQSHFSRGVLCSWPTASPPCCHPNFPYPG